MNVRNIGIDNADITKTGTTTVGIVCKDGIVLAADKRTTGAFVVHKHEKKIHTITDYIAVTTAGIVSDIQLFLKLIKAEIRLKDLQTDKKTSVKEAANMLSGMFYSNVRQFIVLGDVGFMLAGYDKNGFQLYDVDADGALMEYDDYNSVGSGSVFAIGALEALYKKNMTIEEGVKLAVKAVNSALQRDLATGNGIDVVTITKDGVKTVLEKELELKLEV